MKRLPVIMLAAGLLLAACADSGEGDSTQSVSADAQTSSTLESSDTDVSTGDTGTQPPVSELPSALDDPRSEEFADPLIPLERIRSGGPPPDGIPPIDDPKFIPVSEVDFLEDNQPVLALTIGDQTKAYPIQIMTWHEIANDSFGGEPVTVSYCPLCNSAVAYVGRLSDGTEVDFGTSGKLYNSSLVMYDRQTESLWTHFDGRAVVGALVGEQLELIPLSTMGWGDFVEAYGSDALVLSRDTGHSRDYGRNPYVGYDDINKSPFLFDGDLDERLPAQTRVVAVRGDESVVIPQETLGERGVMEFTLDDEDLVALYVAGTSSALETQEISDGRDVGATGVFVPRIADTDVQISVHPNNDELFVDELGNEYNIAGVVVSGPNEGDRLEQVEALNTFWFAIAAFRPDSTIVS